MIGDPNKYPREIEELARRAGEMGSEGYRIPAPLGKDQTAELEQLLAVIKAGDLEIGALVPWRIAEGHIDLYREGRNSASNPIAVINHSMDGHAPFRRQAEAIARALALAYNLAPALIAGVRETMEQRLVNQTYRDAVADLRADLQREREQNRELREWRDAAVASCAKRRCSERDAELRAANEMRDGAMATTERMEHERDTAQRDLAAARAALERVRASAQIQASDHLKAIIDAALSGRAEGAPVKMAALDTVRWVIQDELREWQSAASRKAVERLLARIAALSGTSPTPPIEPLVGPDGTFATSGANPPVATSGGGERLACWNCGSKQMCGFYPMPCCSRCDHDARPTTPTPSEGAGEGPIKLPVGIVPGPVGDWVLTDADGQYAGNSDRREVIEQIADALNATQSAPASDADALLDALERLAKTRGSVLITGFQQRGFLIEVGEEELEEFSGASLREALRAARAGK